VVLNLKRLTESKALGYGVYGWGSYTSSRILVKLALITMIFKCLFALCRRASLLTGVCVMCSVLLWQIFIKRLCLLPLLKCLERFSNFDEDARKKIVKY
jgi:hypothetical protein